MRVAMYDVLNWFRHRKVFASLLVLATLAVGILIGTMVSGRAGASREQVGDGAPTLAIPSPVQLSSLFASIANKLEPAVVNISTTQVIERRSRTPRRTPRPYEEFPFPFDRFFGFPDEGPQAERSLGSGVIVDKRGYILTNYHVVEQATKIQVKLSGDPTRYVAKVIGSDSETDLAVIKIDVQRDLPTARLGNSDAVQVGDWVLAFGSPFGLEATVTAGIVSAKDRSGVSDRQFQRFIQTDAAINPGNSGGPLVNMAGEVIGINTAIITNQLSRGFEGVGFALPSNTAIQVYNQLIKTGKVTRGSIGISFLEERSNNPVLLEELGAKHGMVIEAVEPGSPAEQAGLKAGDLITHVNDKPVRTGSELVDPITQTPIGEKVRITYVRNRKQAEVWVQVADRSKVFARLAGGEEEPQRVEGSGPAELGLSVEELSADMAQRLGISAGGVMVTEVEPASFAEEIGIARGDVIQEVQRTPVNSVGEFRRLLSQLKPGQNVLFKLVRRAGRQLLTVHVAGVVPRKPE